MKMPLIGLGTWQIGGRFERDMSRKAVELASIEHALSLGYRLIDTAEVYGAGGAEEIVGEAIKDTPREDLYIVSKVWQKHLHRDSVSVALDGTLRRLQSPYVDMYLIHWPNPEIPIKETLKAIEELQKEGKIRAIGVSNFGVPALEEALEIGVPITVNQVEYSIVNREAEHEIVPFCKTHAIHVMAYRPLGRGNLAGAPTSLFSIAKNRSAAPAQIALSFITSQGHTAIPKASRIAHIEENWGSQNYPLSAQELEQLQA